MTILPKSLSVMKIVDNKSDNCAANCVLVDFVLATITAMITDTSFLNKYTTGTFNKLQLSLFFSSSQTSF